MTIQTEVVIVGAGPCGLFQVFELGLLGIKAHLLDSLPGPGGQCAELYPEKPIYDIPALPVCGAQELVDRLLEQIKPFGAVMHFGHEVPGAKTVVSMAGDRPAFDAGAVIIAGGVGSFSPAGWAWKAPTVRARRSLSVAAAGLRAHLVIFGGSDSALDGSRWPKGRIDDAGAPTFEFRAAPASVAKMQRWLPPVAAVHRGMAIAGHRGRNCRRGVKDAASGA
jgi:thioredoxin reductase (NADPH)